jgi:hypothetical protein
MLFNDGNSLTMDSSPTHIRNITFTFEKLTTIILNLYSDNTVLHCAYITQLP